MQPQKVTQQPNDEDNQNDDVDIPATEGTTKPSKNQLKKLREKKKKEAAIAAALQQQQKQPEAPIEGEVQKNEQVPKAEEKPSNKKGDKKGDKKPTAAAVLAKKAMESKLKEDQEVAKAKAEFERKQKQAEQAQKQRIRLEEIEKAKKRQIRKQIKADLKKKGLYVSSKNKAKLDKLNNARKQFLNQQNQSDDSSDEQPEGQTTVQTKAQPEIKPNGAVENKAQTKVEAPVQDAPKEVQAEAQIQKQTIKQPKKKFVKKKPKTMEEIYAEALKQKEEKQRLEKQRAQAAISEHWANSLQQRKKSEKVEDKPQETKPVPVEVPKPVETKQPKGEKKKKKKDAPEPEKKKEQPQSQILKDHKVAFNVDKDLKYRSPICCILGHVDTGKTTLLDKIRNTNVQENEAGGITQQIGATFFPKVKLVQEVAKCNTHYPVDVDVPGLLIIDTPGHESFANLRSRGSSLCDIAILVIDLMHGLQQQTLESIELLRDRKTPFVVALNKIDRTYAWKVQKDRSSYLALKQQEQTTLSDYRNRLQGVITELNQKGFNTCMYWQNEDPTEYVSLIPTSGVTGEGLPDLLSVLVKYSLTLKSIRQRVKISKQRFNCTVMEVKVIEGHGTTIDCILVDGVLKKNDQIVLLGFNGPIVTNIKALLTPHPMKQMRVKDEYLYHDEIVAANGVKISAPGLDQAVAGTPLFVANTQEQVEDAKQVCQSEYQNIKKKINLSNLGVGVAASTLGSLEALLEYLNTQKIPVSHVSVGPISKDDVMKAMKSLLSQVAQKRRKEYCCLLVFDVKILPDAQKYAEQNGIRIFSRNIIYHLTDDFNKYVKEVKEERRQRQGKQAVFPCILKQVAVFRKCDPIVLGVDVEQGVLKVGTPLCVYSKESNKMKLGVVQSIESNHKKIKEARKTDGSVAIQLGGDNKISSGKDFVLADQLVSIISRKSIDLLKEHYRQEVRKEEWALIIELKPFFNVG